MLFKLLRYYWRPFFAIVLIFAIVGVSFIYSAQTAEKMKIEAYQELDQQWRTDYDLLVSPGQDQTAGEQKQELVRRSDMGNYMGGISREQYEKIKAIEGVEVAAPLSFLGYIESNDVKSDLMAPEDGVYILEVQTEVFDGLRYRKVPADNSFLKRSRDVVVSIKNRPTGEDRATLSDLFFNLGWGSTNGYIQIPFRQDYFWSVIAVDPEEEKKLLNLDSALIEGEYLPNQKQLNQFEGNPMFPLLMQKKSFDVRRTVKIDQVVDPELSTYISDPLRYKEELAEFVRQHDVKQLPRKTLLYEEFNPYGEDFIYFNGPINVKDGKLVKNDVKAIVTMFNPITYELSALQHQSIGEMDGNPLYLATPVGISGEQINYRTLRGKFGDKGFGYDVYGIFDATLLHNPYSTSKEPRSPDFYNPDKVYITHDTKGNPLPKRVEYQSPPSKEGYSTGGVDAITTLEAAEYLLGEKPISIIRVVVEGAGERSPASMEKVERIAEQIRKETGLHVDVMLGAADRKVQVLLDDYQGVPGYGYLLEGWSQAGASFVIEERVNNTNLLLSGYIFMMGLLGVFLVYRNYAEVRKKDLLIQYTFGWRKSAIFKQLLHEALLIVCSVAAILWVSKFTMGRSWTWAQFGFGALLLMLVAVLSIFLFYILPIMSGFEKQIHLKSSGQVILPVRTQAPSQSLWGYLWHTMIRYALRSALKFLILLATVIYVFLFLLTKGSSSGFLTLTFMGENIDLMLEPYQWILFGFGLILSMGSYLAMQMNQMEKRTQEIQLFQEWGWQTKRWLQLYLMEELLIAIAAVGIGIGGGYGLIYALAQTKVISVTSLILFSITTILFALVALIFTLSTRSKQTRLREFN
jgi:hypothetical protein